MRGLLVGLIAAASLAASARWGSFVAGGSDSYCYVSQSQRWAELIRHPRTARLQPVEPLALDAPWPDAPLTFAPVGHTPSRTVRGATAPICPPGLSMVMALVVAFGGPSAAFAVVPLFGALLIVATYAVGARFGARIGVASALLVAASPIVLYQVVQPMSDVPAAALWISAVAFATGTGRRQAAMSGLATSAAILVRPNLLPLGVAIGVFLLARPERPGRQRLTAASQYAMTSAIGCLAVALVHQAFFGSPVASGYGSFGSLFSLGNVVENTRRYLTWLWDTHTPAVVLAAVAPFLLPGVVTTLLLVLIGINMAVYLPYVVFDDWWYLRFLLPTIPLILILVVAVIDAVCRRFLRLADTRPVVVLGAVLLSVVFIQQAGDRLAFRLQRLESRFERAGTYVKERLPPNALVFTAWHSGSVRYYAERKTIVWDVLHPDWLDPALDFLRVRGYEPFFLFEGQEERLFRERFRGSAAGALDWPPAAEIMGQVRIYRPADRDVYRQGGSAPTEYVR